MAQETDNNQMAPASCTENSLLDGDSDDATFCAQVEQLEQVWSHQHRHLQLCKIRDFEKEIEMIRIRIDDICLQCDSICDHFVSLALAKILQRHLRSFLRNLQVKVDRLTPQLKEATTVVDTLEADIGGYRRSLDSKAEILAKMMHHTSTQHYLKMMIDRIAALEMYFTNSRQRKQNEVATPNFFTDKTAKDLQYLRVRLRSIQSAITAARHDKEVSAIQAMLYGLLFRVDRVKSELTIASTRMTRLNEQMTIWRAQFDQSSHM